MDGLDQSFNSIRPGEAHAVTVLVRVAAVVLDEWRPMGVVPLSLQTAGPVVSITSSHSSHRMVPPARTPIFCLGGLTRSTTTTERFKSRPCQDQPPRVRPYLDGLGGWSSQVVSREPNAPPDRHSGLACNAESIDIHVPVHAKDRREGHITKELLNQFSAVCLVVSRDADAFAQQSVRPRPSINRDSALLRFLRRVASQVELDPASNEVTLSPNHSSVPVPQRLVQPGQGQLAVRGNGIAIVGVAHRSRWDVGRADRPGPPPPRRITSILRSSGASSTCRVSPLVSRTGSGATGSRRNSRCRTRPVTHPPLAHPL